MTCIKAFESLSYVELNFHLSSRTNKLLNLSVPVCAGMQAIVLESRTNGMGEVEKYHWGPRENPEQLLVPTHPRCP